jgi:hypothetical protein
MNESAIAGQSATQSCECFEFFRRNLLITFIDTPRIGDTHRINADNKNMENNLSFMGQFNEIHTFCLLFKLNNSRITVNFEFCIKQLLCHLQKNASRNILFILTKAKSSHFSPGDTAPALRQILDQIKNRPPFVEIFLN